MKQKQIDKINDKINMNFKYLQLKKEDTCSKCRKTLSKGMIVFKYEVANSVAYCRECMIEDCLSDINHKKASIKTLKRAIVTINRYKKSIDKHNIIEAI